MDRAVHVPPSADDGQSRSGYFESAAREVTHAGQEHFRTEPPAVEQQNAFLFGGGLSFIVSGHPHLGAFTEVHTAWSNNCRRGVIHEKRIYNQGESLGLHPGLSAN
jgi:hypothetical protein